MPNDFDAQLRKTLANYHVAEADPALLDRIVAAAGRTPPTVLLFWRRPSLRRGSLCAFFGIALLGFYLGHTTTSQPHNSPQTQNLTSALESAVWGTTEIKEIML